MTDGLTPSQRLAETLLGQPLAAYLSDKRNARPVWSWRLIAEQLAADTGGAVTVSHETVRAWAVQLDAEAAATDGARGMTDTNLHFHDLDLVCNGNRLASRPRGTGDDVLAMKGGER